MAILTLELDNRMSAELDAHCAEAGITHAELLTKMIRDHLFLAAARKDMADPKWAEIYRQMEAEGLLDVDPHEYDDLLTKTSPS